MFSKYSALLGAGAALLGLAQADSFNVDKVFKDTTLYAGVGVPSTAEAPAANVNIAIPDGQIQGDITVSITDQFLVDPILKLDVGGLQAYLELDQEVGASVSEAIELTASPKLSIDALGLLEVDIGAALALDLLIQVSAEIDLSAGVYINIPQGAFIEVNILTQEISSVNLAGITAKALPLNVAADVDLSVAIDLEVGLRLRAEVELDAGLDIIGLDIGAGALIAVWVNLLDITQVLAVTPSCALQVTEDIKLAAGVALDLDVDVANLLDLNIAPKVSVILANLPQAAVCVGLGSGSSKPGHHIGAGGSVRPSATASAQATTTAAAVYTNGTGSGMTTSTDYITSTYTITSCAASVPNCPASHTQKVVTSVVYQTTTICPVTATEKHSATMSTAAPSTSVSVKTPPATSSMTPCPQPSTSTVSIASTCPTPEPTVTVTESTTICPVTATETGLASSSAAVSTPASAPATATATPVAPSASATYPGYPMSSATGVPSASAPCYGCAMSSGSMTWSTYVSPYPSGTGAPAPKPVSPSGSASPSPSPVIAGAGKVGAMVGAAIIPALLALF